MGEKMTDNELRDHFAGLAMTTFCHDDDLSWGRICRVLREAETKNPTEQMWIEASDRYAARRAYATADAMMVERGLRNSAEGVKNDNQAA